MLEIKVSSTSASVNQLPSDNSVTLSRLHCQLPVGSEGHDTTLSDDEIASVVEGSSSMSAVVRGNPPPGNDTKKDDEFPARKQRRKGEAQRLKDNLHSGVLQSSEKRSRKK